MENSSWRPRHNQNDCNCLQWTSDLIAFEPQRSKTKKILNFKWRSRLAIQLQNGIGTRQPCFHIIRIQYNQVATNKLPHCIETHHKQVVLISTDWLRLIAICWQSARVYTLDSHYVTIWEWLLSVQVGEFGDMLPPSGDLCNNLEVVVNLNYLQLVFENKRIQQTHWTTTDISWSQERCHPIFTPVWLSHYQGASIDCMSMWHWHRYLWMVS